MPPCSLSQAERERRGCCCWYGTCLLSYGTSRRALHQRIESAHEGFQSNASRTAATDCRTASRGLSLDAAWSGSVSHAVDSHGRLERRHLDAQCWCCVV